MNTKPLTYQSVLATISCNGAIARNKQPSEAQLKLIALLIVKTGCRWTNEGYQGMTSYTAKMLINQLKQYEAAGGYKAFVDGQIAAQRALEDADREAADA